MAVVSCLRVRMERSTRAACSPGGEVCSEIPRDPRGAASEVLIFSVIVERMDVRSTWSVAVCSVRTCDDVVKSFEDGRCGLGCSANDGQMSSELS